MQGRPLSVVFRVNVLPSSKEELDGIEATLLTSEMERNAVSIITNFNISVLRHKQLEKGNMVVHGSEVKGSFTQVRVGIHISTVINQNFG